MLPCALAVCVALSCPREASAQGAPTASETAAARQLFEEGVEALEGERWEEARDRLQRSYDLVPRASTLMNLGTAQAELGLLVEAIETYRRFLAEMTAREARHRSAVEAMIAELEPRVAHVDVTIPDLAPGDVVRLDGRELPTAALDVALPMSPGAHQLRVLREGREIGRVDLALVEGERRGVEVALHPPPPVVALDPVEEPPPPSDDTGLFIGIGVGVGLGVAALVTIVLAVVLSSGGEEPFVGNLGPGMVTF